MSRRLRYSEEQARQAIAASHSYSDALRRLGLRPAGGNHATLKRNVRHWGISVEHFDFRPQAPQRPARPLAEVLVVGSSYPRGHLKRRLLAEGLKQLRCELCGQRETWRGVRMALVLDHVNGVWNDNRLDNLRILCPNCNATLDTHCGRKNRREPRSCEHCAAEFRPRSRGQRFCSRRCGVLHNAPALRVVERPSLDALRRDVITLGYAATSRKYGVSDNAIRKWLRAHEREAA